MSLDFQNHSLNKPTAAEQSQFLLHVIKQATKVDSVSKTEQALITSLERDCKSILKSEHCDNRKLADMRNKIRHFIPELERHNHAKLIAHFQNHGLYRMFYHKARIKGERDKSGLEFILPVGFLCVALSAVAVIIFSMVSVLGAPAWIMVMANGMFASAMVYLSAIAYGIVNDLYATHSNLPYFLFGHQVQQHSIIETNDPIAQGIAWGVAATFGPAVIAATLFGIVATINGIFAPVANIVFPIGLTTMPLLAMQVDKYAEQRKLSHLNRYREMGMDDSCIKIGSNEYQRNGSMISANNNLECLAAYRANSDRNLFGFTKVPFIGVGMLGTMLAMSGAHAYLPAFLFSTAATTILPITVAGISIIAIGSAGIYTYVNRNKQIDNRFKLVFDQELDADLEELYLDEDRERIQAFTIKHAPATSPTPIADSASITTYFQMKSSQIPDKEVDNMRPDTSQPQTKLTFPA